MKAMKAISLIVLFCSITFCMNAQKVVTELHQEYNLKVYRLEYITIENEGMKYIEIPPFSYKDLMEQNKKINAIFRKTLGKYICGLKNRLGVNINISTKGDILNISLSVKKELASNISNESFEIFANEVKNHLIISDFLDLKKVSKKEGYCTIAFFVDRDK